MKRFHTLLTMHWANQALANANAVKVLTYPPTKEMHERVKGIGLCNRIVECLG